MAWGVFAFALLQVYEPIMHGLHLPEWTLGLVVVLLAAGFPGTAALAWVFDVGPGGVVRTAPAELGPGPAPSGPLRGWRLGVVLGALGVLAAAPGLVYHFGWRAPRPSATPGGGAPTLAVLPLSDLSGDPAQSYFSEGMTEEITSKLAQLRGLAVTAASSVARYRNAPADPRRIGEELGVAYVLEGSVRRSGDRVRVSARLVKTADGFRVWSDDIDAKLDDVFAVQEKVATRIVEALGVHLEPGESRALTDWGTRNAAAYDEYLRGLALAEHFNDRDRLDAGRRHFERALAIDPGFAPAHTGLAEVEVQTYRNFETTPEHLARAEASVAEALRLDPTFALARLDQASLKAIRFDYAGAVEDLRRVTADHPRNYLAWDRLCWALAYLEPPEAAEAERACRRSLEINPAFGEAYYHLARALVFLDRAPEAEQAIHDLEEMPGTKGLVALARYWLHLTAGRPAEALAALRTDTTASSTALGLANEAMALGQLRRNDEALERLERALVLGYRDVPALRRSRGFAALREDPRLEPLLARHGIPR